MLMGPADGLSEPGSSSNHLIADPESVLDVEDEEEQLLYAASFEELARNYVKYETIIWVSISLLLVLAWGIGIIMLLCLPIRRCMLQKDISSRKLYVTANEIVYKFSRPSILFWRVTTIEKRTPLSLVIDIIIEQGCLQSVYGIHTFRVESIAHGKAAPVDELQVQGLTDPGVLRKVIITEALKNVQDFGKGWKPTLTGEEESMSTVGSLNEGPTIFKSPSKSWKVTASPRYTSLEHRGSPRHTSLEHRGLIQGEMLLNKLEEVSKSVKKIESLVEKSQASPESS